MIWWGILSRRELFVNATRRETLFIFWRVGVACLCVFAYSLVMSIYSVTASPVGVPVCVPVGVAVAPSQIGSVMSVSYDSVSITEAIRGVLNARDILIEANCVDSLWESSTEVLEFLRLLRTEAELSEGGVN